MPNALVNGPAGEIVKKLEKLAQQMIGAVQKLRMATTDRDTQYYAAKCRDLDRRINEAVYAVYGLTSKEQELVERQEPAEYQ